jgi:hypothetical protein
MGTKVTDFINIQISRQTTAVSRAAFNIPMYLGTHAAFTERAQEFTSLDGVAELFDSASPVYKAAEKMFGQELVPQRIVIGRRAVQGATVSVSSVLASYTYKLTVNGQVISFTSDSTPTGAEIATGLKAAFDAATPAIVGVTATVSGSTVVLAAASTWSVKVGTNLSLTYNASSETYTDALNAVVAANNNWYGFAADTKVKADQLALAQAISDRKQLYFTSSSDSTAKGSTTTDIGQALKDGDYDRVFVIWSSVAETEQPEVAVMSKFMQYTVGSATAKFKQFTGITVEKLTDNEVANLKAKNYNVYELVGGVNMLSEGVCAGGEFLDTMFIADWTEARMRERIYSKLVNMLKVPFTRAGAAMIEADIRAVWQEGVINGAFTSEVPPTIQVPDPITLDPNLRALRKLEGITFDFRLAGAIHYIGIKGVISV